MSHKDPWDEIYKKLDEERIKEENLLKRRYNKKQLFNMALKYTKNKEFEKAIKFFRLVTEIDPQDFQSWYNQGFIYISYDILGEVETINNVKETYYKRHYKEGIECFQKALEIQPEDTNCLMGLGDAYRGLKDFKNAIKYYKLALEKDPVNSQMKIGFCLLETRSFNNALNYFENVLKIQKNNIDCLIGQGIAYFEMRNLNKALELFNIAGIKAIQKFKKTKKNAEEEDKNALSILFLAKLINYIEDQRWKIEYIEEIEDEFNIKFKDSPLDSILSFFDNFSSELKFMISSKKIKKSLEEDIQIDEENIQFNRISHLQKILLHSEDENKKLKVLSELKNIGNEKSERAIISAYDDESEDVRKIVIETIEKAKFLSKKEIIDILIKLIEDKSYLIREKAVKLLTKYKSPKLLPYFLKKLIDESPNIGIQAAIAIGNIRDKRALKYLLRVIKQNIVFINFKGCLIWAIGQIGDDSVNELLINYLLDNNEDSVIRGEAAVAMARIGGESALMAIEKVINERDWKRYSYKEEIEFKKDLIEALTYFDKDKVIDTILKFLEQEYIEKDKHSATEEIIIKIIEALGIIKHNRALKKLTILLYDLNTKIRLVAAGALIRFRNNEINQKLISILTDDSESDSFKTQLLKALEDNDREELFNLLNHLKNQLKGSKLILETRITNNVEIITIKDKNIRKKIYEFSRKLSSDEIAKIQEERQKEIKLRAKVKEEQRILKEKLNREKNFNLKFEELVKLMDENNLQKLYKITDNIKANNLLNKMREINSKLNLLYKQYNNEDKFKNKILSLTKTYYSQFKDFDPFDIKINNFSTTFNSFRRVIIQQLDPWKGVSELQNTLEELTTFNNKSIIYKQLSKIEKEIKIINYDVPITNMFNFLLDFSKVIPLGSENDIKTEDSTEVNYTLSTYFGPLNFKIIEKEFNKKLVYEYDFLESQWGEKGVFYIEFNEPKYGTVELKIRNKIQEISKNNIENLIILNILGNYLKVWLDFNLSKIVARQIQAILYEKTFDDLTIRNYRILQAKLNVLGKSIEDLKNRFFEVKAPLTLDSFECSECGATLKITSKDEKFIICEHCNTPFLMEWQKQ
ncbi:MAG: HEAT repeat domain-containing protein [Promethearchaeota archaeon]